MALLVVVSFLLVLVVVVAQAPPFPSHSLALLPLLLVAQTFRAL